MSDENPYLAPQVEVTNKETSFTEDGSAYRDGKLLVINKYYQPPVRCLFTGEDPVHSNRSRKLHLVYYPPYCLFFLLLGIAPGALIILFFQKRLTIHSYNGKTLQIMLKKRRIISGILAILTIIFVTLISLGLFSSVHHKYLIILGSAICGMFSLALLGSQPKTLTVKKYKKKYFFVKGVHESILALYPTVPDILAPPQNRL